MDEVDRQSIIAAGRGHLIGEPLPVPRSQLLEFWRKMFGDTEPDWPWLHAMAAQQRRIEGKEVQVYELVIYDPGNIDTYPSVCSDPESVKARFGLVGGECLVYDFRGNYLGLLKEVT